MKKNYFKTSVSTHLFPLRGLGGFLLLFPFLLSAQQDWQWGVRGGSERTYNSSTSETIIDMAVDKEGNSYIVSDVGDLDFDVEGVEHDFHLTSGSTARSILIASFDCEGNYRWGKMISGPGNGRANAIRTDTLGKVYVTGKVPHGMYNHASQQEFLTHFDTDSIIPYSADPNTYKKNIFLARYDTNGNFEQLIMPQADDVGQSEANSGHGTNDLAVAPDGTTYWWIKIGWQGGGVLEGENLPAGNYVLKYDAQGNFVERVDLDMDIHMTTRRLQMAHDPVSDAYYFAGQNQTANNPNETFYVGNQEVVSPMFVAKFNGQGGLEWLRQGETGLNASNRFIGRPVLDDQGNIYLSGSMHSLNNNHEAIPVEFNGFVAHNTLGIQGFPVLIKMDPAGNVLWGTHGETESGGVGIAYVGITGNEAVLASLEGGISWGSVYFPPVTNTGYDIFLARFNKEDGAFIDMINLESNTGFTEFPSSIESDNRGNVYVGGRFTSQLIINDNQTLYINGGSSDFFVAKYGQDNCDCELPEASFSYSGAGNGTINLNYTGSAYDELEWGLGDGTSQTTTNGSLDYSYTANGTYWVCVTAYNDCGNDTWCMEVDPHTMDVKELEKDQFTYYPNPVKELLNLEAKETLSYQLFSLAGRQLQSGQLQKGSNHISFENLAKGVYMLKLENQRGQTTTVKVVKAP